MGRPRHDHGKEKGDERKGDVTDFRETKGKENEAKGEITGKEKATSIISGSGLVKGDITLEKGTSLGKGLDYGVAQGEASLFWVFGMSFCNGTYPCHGMQVGYEIAP